MLLVMQKQTAFVNSHSSCWRTIQQKEFDWRHTEASSSLKLHIKEEKREKERRDVTVRADEFSVRSSEGFQRSVLHRGTAETQTPQERQNHPDPQKFTGHTHKNKRKSQRRQQTHFQLSDSFNSCYKRSNCETIKL